MINEAIDSMTAQQDAAMFTNPEELLLDQPVLGCYYTSSTQYTNYDLCSGSMCAYNSQCESGCCWSVSGYSYSYAYSDYCQTTYVCDSWDDVSDALTWLWVTISVTVFLCIIGCIICCVCCLKKRRREAELLQAMHHDAVNHSQNSAPTVVFTQQQPVGGQPG